MVKKTDIGEVRASEGKYAKVVKISRLSVKITACLVSISQLLCLAFLYRWHFLNKISLDWMLTLTTQPSTSRLSDNPYMQLPCSSFEGLKACLNKELAYQEAYLRRRENQLFEGIKKVPVRESNFEDTASVLLLFLSSTLKIDCYKEVEFQRFHHLGGKKVQKSLES